MRDYTGLSRALETRKKERVGKTVRIHFQTMSRVHTKEKLNVWIVPYMVCWFALLIIFWEGTQWFDRQQTDFMILNVFQATVPEVLT